MKTLNILTRTSGRPNFFKVCKDSIRAQDYPNIKHWVIVDDRNDNSYINEYTDIEVINVTQEKHDHFETYLNEGLDRLSKGELFCVMDDDDFYVSSDSLSRGVNALGDGQIVFFQVQCAGGLVPQYNMMVSNNKFLEGGQISMEGFIMQVDVTWNPNNGERIQFPGAYGGDWQFIDMVACYNYDRNWNDPRIKWLPTKLASTNPCRRQGGGTGGDMPYDQIISGYRRSR